VGDETHTRMDYRTEGMPVSTRLRERWFAQMPNAQSPDTEPAAGTTRPQLFGDGTALEDVSFLTVAEVAGVMRVSKMTVYRMVHSGELTAVRVGRSFRVPAKAVREYLSGAYVGSAD
jgi:excisionase family DNA binding protein